MFSLESVEVPALCPNDILIFTLYVIISNNVPNWAIFVKKNGFNLMCSLVCNEITGKPSLWMPHSQTVYYYNICQPLS